MTMAELKNLEKTEGFLKFDIFFKQIDDEKTIWGDSEMLWSNISIRHQANFICDVLFDNYDVWIRETPLLENGPSKISEKYLRYVMTLEAKNMFHEMVVLKFRLVNGWFVISMEYGEGMHGKKRSEFYSKFDIEEYLKSKQKNV
jgi:hypothetical protein